MGRIIAVANQKGGENYNSDKFILVFSGERAESSRNRHGSTGKYVQRSWYR